MTTATKRRGKNLAEAMEAREKRDAELRARRPEFLNGHADTRPDLRNTTLPSGVAARDPDAKASDPQPSLPSTAVDKIVPIDSIDVSPYQPRQDFDEAEIEALAEDMRVRGQKDALNGRWVGDSRVALPRVELTDGERRLRAAKLLVARGVPGWESLRVRVWNLSDAQAERDTAFGNLFRENLNPLELAAAYRHWLSATGKTQQDLAELLKKDQGTVSHALRLLELPEWAKAEVMARRMSASHAREIAEWVKYPGTEKALAKIWKEEIKRHGEAGSLGEWKEAVLNAVENTTGEMEHPHYWDKSTNESFSVRIDPTPEERAQLGIVTIPTYVGSKQTEERATNATLHKKLWDAAVKEARKKAKVKEQKGTKGTKKGTGEKAKGPTPAERKKREREQAEQFAKRLQRWKCDWLAWLVAPRLNGSKDAAVTWHIMLYLATFETEWGVEGATDERRRRESLSEVLYHATGKNPPAIGPGRFQAIRQAVEPGQPMGPKSLGLIFLRRLLWDPGEQCPARLLPGYVIEAAAADLGIDLAAEWTKKGITEEQRSPPWRDAQAFAGPMTESFFDLHSKEQLASLGEQWDVFIDAGKPKATIIGQLRAGAAVRPLPRELAAIAPKVG